ncbi:serine-rich adhesin for platelets [Anopheles cruzii]|uniref:serine-rich adhesin for platelets n=1 Tax=Anopheles cruzii TaxID=68878 RepID=UPI0022EC76CC|nr:serine-rich adhesin for platelets [Anopheles cruzii]
MPRIDPMKLLVCLSVLLAPNGGILAAAEVKRLANLMAKFSKKLVSKCIYIQILKCTETDLLGQFMQTGGWSLVHMWLVDGIGSKNWPLIQELLELLLCCPVDVERLKINSTPRLVKSLSTDSAHERVRVLASKLVEQWLFIVKAPKHSSPMVPLATATSDAAAITAGGVTVTQHTNVPAIAAGSTAAFGEANNRVTGSETTGRDGTHMYNGSAEGGSVANLAEDDEKERSMKVRKREDDIDSAKKTFRALVEQEPHKKTSLVLKITTKNGKQVVAKVVSPGSKKLKQGTDGTIHGNGTEDEDDQDEDDEEEVVVNIESEKHHSDDTVPEAKQLKKHEHHEHAREGKERSGSISSASSKDRHHSRDREKERKGSSSGSSGRSSSSKNSGSSGSTGNHNSSSSKHKSGSSSSRSGSSSSSRDKERDRHGGSSSSSSKHKSSSSSSSKSSSSSGSKSSGGSDKHRDHKDRSSHSGGTSGRDNKDSKGQSLSPSSSSSKVAKLSRKSSKDDVNDSGSESGSASGGAGAKSGSGASNVPGGHKKAASISIEVRNPENRPKTVKTYNSQFRSHGLIEEAPPPPSRKGLKKPSTSTSSPSAAAATVGAGSAGATNTAKRLSPPPSSSPSSSSNGGSMEKRIREDPVDRPGAIKLIAAPKRQHALVESDMFMDALSATLRKDVKKRKRRTSGSESTGSSTPVVVPVGKASESGKPCDSSPTKTTVAPESPTTATAPAIVSEPKPEVAPVAPTSPAPKAIPPPIVAPMSFYRDTLAEDEETSPKDGDLKQEQDSEEVTAAVASGVASADVTAESNAMEVDEDEDNEEEEQMIIPKSKRMKMTLKDDDEDDEMGEGGKETLKGSVKKDSETSGEAEETTKTEQNALVDAMMTDVEMKMAAEEADEEGSETGNREPDDDGSTEENADKLKKPPGPGCGPDGPPGVLVIHRRKGPKKQLRWRAADDLEEIRYFELDVTERCNVTKSFTDMKQLERVDERQNFRMARKVGSEDNMTERTPWRALLVVDNVPPSPDGSQSLERNIQHQRERIVLQALYFNKSMIPDSPFEADPIDTYQTADPVHIPLEDVTGNPDSVNDFTSMPWPDARSTPPHESAAFNSPFFPTDLPPAAGFGPGGFPPPFAAGGPAPWQLPGPPGAAVVGGPRTSLPPGIFSALNQPPPGMPPMVVGSSGATGGAAGGAGGNSPNILNLPLNIPPNVPPPGMFPGAATFNSPPPDIALLEAGGRRGGGDGNFRGGIPPPWISNNRSFGGSGGNHPPRGGGYGGHRGGGPGGNWNTRNAGNGNRAGDRGRNGDDNRGNYRGPPGTGAPWLQTSRGRGGVGARKW